MFFAFSLNNLTLGHINVTRHKAINCIVLIYELYTFNNSMGVCLSKLASPSVPLVKPETCYGRARDLYSVNNVHMKLFAMILRSVKMKRLD